MSTLNLGFQATDFKQVSLIEIPEVFFNRFKTGIASFDDLLGGEGFLPGSTFTVTGKAGAGKTTFLLQLLESLQAGGKMTGYVSSEESVYQLAYTCKRLNIQSVQIANMTDADDIAEQAKNFDVLIVDSFQFLTCRETEKPLATQKYAIKKLINAAQHNQCVIGIVQHLTVSGAAKGGTTVPHAVDMNMQIVTFEEDPTLKSVEIYKNRFGKCGQIALKMTDHGFDFEHQIQDLPEQSEKYAKAVDNGVRDRKYILDYLTEHKKATVDDLLCETIPNWRIPHYLRLLVNENLVIKIGRGEEAYWKLASKSK